MLSTDAFEEFSKLCPIPIVFHPLILPSGPTVNDVLQFRGLPPITHETIPLSFGNSTSVLTEHNFHILRAMRVPPVKQLNELLHIATDAHKRGCSTVQYSNPSGAATPGSLAFPFWIILWWCRIHAISEAQMSWNEALGFLDQLKRKEALAQELIARILVLHWNMEVPSSLGGNSTTSMMTMTTLAHYCGQKWLKTCHLEQMTAVLQRRLDNAGLQGVMIAEPTFFQSLTMKYRASDKNENFPVSQRLIAGSLSRVGFAVCVRMDRGKTVLENQEAGIWGNHWIALVVDTAEAKIRYSDSFDSPLPTEIIDILYWWLTRHGFDKFEIFPLPFTRQRDSFSCGILSIDSISHYFLPEIPLLSSNECLIGRLRMLKNILDFTDMPVSLVYVVVIAQISHACRLFLPVTQLSQQLLSMRSHLLRPLSLRHQHPGLKRLHLFSNTVCQNLPYRLILMLPRRFWIIIWIDLSQKALILMIQLPVHQNGSAMVTTSILMHLMMPNFISKTFPILQNAKTRMAKMSAAVQKTR